MTQITNTVLMIRPASFRMNEETAVNNYFQKKTEELHEEVNQKAQAEFDRFVEKLRSKGIRVVVVQDDPANDTPDALFPNNWVSFHEGGRAALYPMFAANRRRERRQDVFDQLKAEGVEITTINDYSPSENDNVFLEGTGSLILDREHKKAYCALSPRADKKLLEQFCNDFNYTPIAFTANQTVEGKRMAIYHTNVMMCIGENFSVICLESIDDDIERSTVVDNLTRDGKEIIAISEEQMHQFAGNMLQVKSEDGQPYLVMSKTAHDSLIPEQLEAIEKYCPILSADLNTIEVHGGGSARCMLAEVFH